MTDKKRPEQKTVRDMNKFAITLLCCAALAACGGNTSDTGSGDNAARLIGGGGGLGPPPAPPEDEPPEEEPPIDEEEEIVIFDDLLRVGGDVTSMVFDPERQVLTIQGDPFDFTGDFTRSPDEDVPGFTAFRSPAGEGVDPSGRPYLAYLATDAINGLSAGVVGAPFRLRTEYGGTLLSRAEVPELPSNIQMTHDGTYAAVRTLGGAQHRIQGETRLFLDFFDDRNPAIEGAILDRQNLDTGESPAQITLIFANIDENGNFRGTAYDEEEDITGNYDGIIGGEGAAASAGVLVISGTIDGVDHVERGAFIARRRD